MISCKRYKSDVPAPSWKLSLEGKLDLPLRYYPQSGKSLVFLRKQVPVAKHFEPFDLRIEVT